MKMTVLVEMVRLFSPQHQVGEFVSERVRGKLSYTANKMFRMGSAVDGGGKSCSHGKSSQQASPNTLVPCQPAQMTDTACLFLASSFS